MKLALILEKSDAYISFQKNEILTHWGVVQSDMKIISRYSEVGGSTLFGDALVHILTVNETDELKTVVAAMDADPNLSDTVGPGLIVITGLPGNSTKKIQELVKRVGGTVYGLSPTEKKDKRKAGEALLGDIRLQRDVREFLVNYVGDDYESLISLVRVLGDLPTSAQQKLTVADMEIRLPQSPGSIPPWEVERALMRGDMDKAISTFRRSAEHSHPLVTLAVLNNKFRLAYRIAALIEATGSVTEQYVADTLGEKKGYPLKLAIDTAKQYKLDKLERIVTVLGKTEGGMKGDLAVPSDVLMEKSMFEIKEIMRS